MNLLILTQKVDKNDDNLGFFHRWLEQFSKNTGKLFVVANYLGNYALPPNVRLESLGREKGLGRIRRYLNFYKYLFEILPKTDAIFVHMIPAWVILVWPIALIFRKKIYLWYTHKSVTFSLRLAETLVEKIFTASTESCRLDSKKIIITGHGIDTEYFKPKDLPKNSESLKILSVGRITLSKDYEFLLEVMGVVKTRGYDAVLDVVGAPMTSADFSYKNKLDDLIKKKSLQNIVNFIGPKTYAEMPDVYSSHDILLHASETGSLDKAVLEAMSCALPVVTTSEAFYKILPDRYLVKQKNPRAMAERIVRLKFMGKDLSLRKTIAQNHNLNNLVEKIVVNL
ncbi:MAG: glycosyltransferase family 4 protein [bacterium]|nr:glycosyltransferase family 4 protein [bacterium]